MSFQTSFQSLQKTIFRFICKQVACSSKLTYQKYAFPSHPSYGQNSSSFDPVVVRTVQTSTHSEVRNLNAVVGSNKAVSGCQISVHHVQGFQILHSGCYLRSHVDQAPITIKKLDVHMSYTTYIRYSQNARQNRKVMLKQDFVQFS